MAHKAFIAFLVFLGLTAAVSIGVTGWDYYQTPVAQRNRMPEHKLLKPSGQYGHGLGIVGGSMIVIGIAMYSTRKRVRALWNVGRLSVWLEVHMFLCLLGPTLVVYHTTFKAGGIAAISLWSMLSVMTSGLAGRFLYVLIPRNVKGAELSSQQINQEFDAQRRVVMQTEIGEALIRTIDTSFASITRPKNFRETLVGYFRLQKTKRDTRQKLQHMLADAHITQALAKQVVRVARSRANLIQRSLLLLQVEKLFYYWHVIHLPFSAIMFVTLLAHVGVGLWLGYTWIF